MRAKPQHLVVGDRVHVHAASDSVERLVGTVKAGDASSLVLTLSPPSAAAASGPEGRPEDIERVIAWNDVKRVELLASEVAARRIPAEPPRQRHDLLWGVGSQIAFWTGVAVCKSEHTFVGGAAPLGILLVCGPIAAAPVLVAHRIAYWGDEPRWQTLLEPKRQLLDANQAPSDTLERIPLPSPSR
ncbi:MAG: hypothetical protein HY275_05440 [Gemmatimonadetes bacterium]|nr:hypothetical protein [Gemmatimonadota bacterium]